MKQIIPEKSSEKVAKFLKKNALHKRDFAEMIGVTLSYVYNLIDETVPFSTRGTTIERIATVMNIEPEEFSEYRIPQEPILIDESIETLKNYIKENKLSIVSFLKSFPRKKRLDIVDVLILLSKEQFAIIHPEFDGDVKSYLLLDPVEKYYYADCLIDICYCESAKILKVNKFIKEYGYKPLVLEIHY